jgi:hypothetical protein
VRVDSFLEPGVGADEVDRWVQSASILHSNGDGLDIAVKDSRIVGVRGRAAEQRPRTGMARAVPGVDGWHGRPPRAVPPRPVDDGRLHSGRDH